MGLAGVILWFMVGAATTITVVLTFQKERLINAKDNLKTFAARIQNYLQERFALKKEIALLRADLRSLEESRIQLIGERDLMEVVWNSTPLSLEPTNCVDTQEAVVFGRGREWVYAYTFPAYVQLAHERETITIP